MKDTALGGRFEALLDHHKRVRFMNVQHCGGQSMVLLQLKNPLELSLKRGQFLPGSEVSILLKAT